MNNARHSPHNLGRLVIGAIRQSFTNVHLCSIRLVCGEISVMVVSASRSILYSVHRQTDRVGSLRAIGKRYALGLSNHTIMDSHRLHHFLLPPFMACLLLIFSSALIKAVFTSPFLNSLRL